jgi:hypothetical protein
MRLDLPVMLAALALTAAAQNLLPGLPGSPLKIPFLTGVVVYYALNRPRILACVCAVWAGWLTDSTGGLPVLCTTSFLLLLAFVLHQLRHLLPEGSWTGAVAVAAAAALPQAVWQLIWARLALPGSVWRLAGDLLLLLPAGAVAGAAAFGLARTLDHWAGNARAQDEISLRAEE